MFCVTVPEKAVSKNETLTACYGRQKARIHVEEDIRIYACNEQRRHCELLVDKDCS